MWWLWRLWWWLAEGYDSRAGSARAHLACHTPVSAAHTSRSASLWRPRCRTEPLSGSSLRSRGNSQWDSLQSVVNQLCYFSPYSLFCFSSSATFFHILSLTLLLFIHSNLDGRIGGFSFAYLTLNMKVFFLCADVNPSLISNEDQ